MVLMPLLPILYQQVAGAGILRVHWIVMARSLFRSCSGPPTQSPEQL